MGFFLWRSRKQVFQLCWIHCVLVSLLTMLASSVKVRGWDVCGHGCSVGPLLWMNKQKEQNIASCNEFSLYLGVCVGKGWNEVLLMKARDLRAPAKPRCTAGNYWARVAVTAMPLGLITMYKLALARADPLLVQSSLLTLDSFAAVCQAFSCSIALPFPKCSTMAAAAMQFGSQGCPQVRMCLASVPCFAGGVQHW